MGKRQVSYRLDAHVAELINKGEDFLNTSKTEFVEQAVIFYYKRKVRPKVKRSKFIDYAGILSGKEAGILETAVRHIKSKSPSKDIISAWEE